MATNWDTGSIPTAIDDVYIDNGGTAQIDASSGSDQNGSVIRVGQSNGGQLDQSDQRLTADAWLTVGEENGSTGVFNLTGGTLRSIRGPVQGATGAINIGNLGIGRFNVGAAATATSEGNLIIGVESTEDAMGDGTVTTSGNLDIGSEIIVGLRGTGTLNIEGGSVNSTNSLKVGQVAGSLGEVIQSGGVVTPAWVTVGGDGAPGIGADGSYTLSGGLLDPLSKNGNVEVGKQGTGLFTQTGGTVNGRGFRLGEESTGDGTFDMSGGELNTDEHVNVVQRGTAVANQAGGTVNAGGWLEIGAGSGSDGTYNLTGGTFNSLGTHPATPGPVRVGVSGKGTLTVGAAAMLNVAHNLVAGNNASSDGTITTSGLIDIDNEIIVGLAGEGTMNINGGTISSFAAFKVGQEAGSDGEVTQTGGRVDAGGWLELGSATGSMGRYTLSGGTLNALGTQPDGEGDSGRGAERIRLDDRRFRRHAQCCQHSLCGICRGRRRHVNDQWQHHSGG